MCRTLKGIEALDRQMNVCNKLPSLVATARDLADTGNRSSNSAGGVQRVPPTFATIGAREYEHALTFATRRLPAMWTDQHNDAPMLCLHCSLGQRNCPETQNECFELPHNGDNPDGFVRCLEFFERTLTAANMLVTEAKQRHQSAMSRSSNSDNTAGPTTTAAVPTTNAAPTTGSSSQPSTSTAEPTTVAMEPSTSAAPTTSSEPSTSTEPTTTSTEPSTRAAPTSTTEATNRESSSNVFRRTLLLVRRALHLSEAATNARQKFQALIAHLQQCNWDELVTEKRLQTLPQGQYLEIQDYKMKLLEMWYREDSTKWYGKRGISGHPTMFTKRQ